jgi:hypothetical protein
MKILKIVEKITNAFEILIALLLLIVIAIRMVEIATGMFDHQLAILNMEFDKILSTALGFVIGLEFTKMLCKHTPESVVDVLLFAVARQLVIYNQEALELLIGVAAISALFATKKYLIDRRHRLSRLEEAPEVE